MADLQGGSQQIDGETPHDDVDAGNPVKIGGTATAAAPAAVGEGDRVQASFDLTGQLRTVGGSIGNIAGDIAHDVADSGNPVKVGGRARLTAIAAVATDDRTDHIYSVTGAATIAGSAAGVPTNVEVGTAGQVNIQGDTAHDAPDSGNPVKIGGIANAAAPAAVAENDRANASFDLQGRLRVTDANAGAGSPSNPVVDTPSLANIASSASSSGAQLRTSDLGGTTRQLAGFDCSGSAPFKAILIQEDDDAETIRTTLFGVAGEPIQFRPPNKGYFNITFGSNAGFDGWRVEVTNLDNSQSADFMVTFYYED